jgi:hypothetical protein
LPPFRARRPNPNGSIVATGKNHERATAFPGDAGVRAPRKPPAAAASAAASAAAPGAPASVGRASASVALETMSMLAPAVATWFWRITPTGGGSGAAAAQQEQEPFLRWLMGLSTRKPGSNSAGGHGGVKKQLPWVQVLLYFEPEALLPRAFTDRVNVELQKVGLRGFSVVVSSGADGAPAAAAPWRREAGVLDLRAQVPRHVAVRDGRRHDGAADDPGRPGPAPRRSSEEAAPHPCAGCARHRRRRRRRRRQAA